MSQSTPSTSDPLEILYVRHVKSQSNREDNSGVHILDPKLLTDDEEREGLPHPKYEGRKYAKTDVAPKLVHELEGATDLCIIVSPLMRAIQTMIIATPLHRLLKAKIIVFPLIMEQTDWFSDRARSVKQIQLVIQAELEQKFKVEAPGHPVKDLDICFNLLLDKPETSNLSTYQEFLSGTAARMIDNAETLNKPWHLKNGLWAPAKLRERSQACLEELSALGKCAKAHATAVGGDLRTFVAFGHGGFINLIAKPGNLDLVKEPPTLTDWKVGEMRRYILQDFDQEGQAQEDKWAWRLERVDEDESFNKEVDNSKKDELVGHMIKIAKENRTEGAAALYNEADERKLNPAIAGSDDDYVQNILSK